MAQESRWQVGPAGAQKILAAQKLIGAALEDGRLGPASAARWARRAAAGDDLGFLALLTAPQGARPEPHLLARSDQQVLDILTAALTGDGHEEHDGSGLIHEPGGSAKGSDVTGERPGVEGGRAGGTGDGMIVHSRTPGAPVPSVNWLRQEYGVAETTARKAVALLRDEGLVETVMGGGSFVAKA